MAYSVTYTHPDFPKGTLFAIYPLGQLSNGEATEIGEDQERDFLATYGKNIRDHYEGVDGIKVGGSPTVKGTEAKELAANALVTEAAATTTDTTGTATGEGGES